MTPARFIKFAGIFIGVFLMGVAVDRLLFSADPEYSEWDVALIDAGLVRPQSVKDVLDLPSTVLTTDSSGKEIVAQQIVLKTERDGKPFVAILYQKQYTLLDNLTVVDTAEVKDTTK